MKKEEAIKALNEAFCQFTYNASNANDTDTVHLAMAMIIAPKKNDIAPVTCAVGGQSDVLADAVSNIILDIMAPMNSSEKENFLDTIIRIVRCHRHCQVLIPIPSGPDACPNTKLH